MPLGTWRVAGPPRTKKHIAESGRLRPHGERLHLKKPGSAARRLQPGPCAAWATTSRRDRSTCVAVRGLRKRASRNVAQFSVATSGRIVSTSDMPNAESALKPGRIFLADGPAGTLGRCWKPLARPRSAGGAPATWPAAWSEAPPAAMAASEMATWIFVYSAQLVRKITKTTPYTEDPR